MKESKNSEEQHSETKPCAELERLLVLYACDELNAEGRAAVEAHVEQCAACVVRLERERSLHQVFAALPRPADRLDPSDSLLARCRSRLGEALDDMAEERARGGWLRGLRSLDWLARSFVAHPAWSAALLVLLGVAVGSIGPRWYSQISRGSPGEQLKPIVVVSTPRLSEQDLQNISVAGINWISNSGSGTPSVELHLTTEKPLVLEGSPDDTDVKRVLTYIIQNGQRFDAGARLDSLDVLRTRSEDAQVRRALCIAAQKDRNPGVRLKALEALRGFEQDEQVRQTLLSALLRDSNPGVRVEAINSLSAALRKMGEQNAAQADPQMVNVLRDLVRKDPNNYIRMQSAAAIRQLTSREEY